MSQKGSVPILFIVVLVVVALIFVYLNKSTFIAKTTPQNVLPNTGNPYQDMKVGLRKAFEK